MATKAAIYMRVSTDEQDQENQLPQLREMADARGYEIVATYEEKVSGIRPVRKEHKRMMEDAHKGKFKVVLVWAIDRLGRGMLGISETILKLDNAGVATLSVMQPWLDTTPKGAFRQLLISIFGFLAEFEREMIIERTKAGMQRAKGQGKVLGRPGSNLDLDEVLRLRKEGMSYEEVGKKLGVDGSTVYREMQRNKDKLPVSAFDRSNAIPKPRMRTRKSA